MYMMLVCLNFQAIFYNLVVLGLEGLIDSALSCLHLLLILQFSFVVVINVLFSTDTCMKHTHKTTRTMEVSLFLLPQVREFLTWKVTEQNNTSTI